MLAQLFLCFLLSPACTLDIFGSFGMGKPWKTRAETIKAPDPSADICSSADGLVEAAELLQGQEP